MSDDSRYVRELAKGSREAFKTLYLQYASLVENFVFSLVKNRQTADDITQNIFLNLWLHREKINIKTSFRSYLFTSSRNAVVDWLRRDVRNRAVGLEEITEDGLASGDHAAGHDYHRIPDIVNKTLARMPRKRRDVFVMSRSMHLKNAEIAAVLGISEKAVEYHITRALADLRKNLEIV